MSDEKKEKQLADYSAEVKKRVPEIIAPVKANAAKFMDALDQLLVLEKKTRLAQDARSTTEVAVAIMQLCVDTKKWDTLNDMIQSLFKKRAQLQKVMHTVVTKAMEFVEQTPSKEVKVALLNTLRTVAAGKMFVELERARMTRILAEMKEAEGGVADAAELMQDVQVETIGAMEVREKASFLLEQLRLCLAKKDFVRSEIIAKKIQPKTLAKEDMQDLKITYHELMIQFNLHTGKYFDICLSYREIFSTKVIQADEAKWKAALKKCVLFLLLSPYDSEVSDVLHRLKADKKTLQLPAAKRLLDQFTTDELIRWPLPDQKEWQSDPLFGDKEKGVSRWEDFHKRVVQHNIRTLALYYSRITSKRLAFFLQLDEEKSEKYVSELVSSKQLHAKIDRPSGIVTFARKQTANDTLEAWANDIDSLLGLVENTCYLINKENMMQLARKQAAEEGATNAPAAAAAATATPMQVDKA